ncbi:acetyl-CoA C-acetyltransferase [Haloarcula vallismortis]|uniref:Acetyl-CoA acetyltransferase n=2 Tax=Haloarcula vallismortis TaxID=28442 RepID=M0IYB7_HALVA|nr:thiolase family protein [Haloarcula vallismortis]EMA01043.1 acetyl-CoA acetyltransferase [Haloarcula vallismortis ATCC 29715]SDW13697.1 acetyl-CoA C-acetyltransferase [Haloarcula vallismortis]
MTDVVLVDGARTAHGELLGGLSERSAIELGTAAVEGLLDRTAIDKDGVDWVGLGNAVQAGVGQVPARQVVVESPLPDDVAATTLNEASGSGLRAITTAADRIEAGRASVCFAGGMESMSNAPYLLPDMRGGRRHGNSELVDAMIWDSLWDKHYDAHMGTLTEELATEHDISREAQDEYARRSNHRAGEAIQSGEFTEELVPVETSDGLITEDEGPRPDATLDRLAALPPAFVDGGTITAGNASKLSDGAGAVVLADAETVDREGLGPMAHVEDYAVAYRDPSEFSIAVRDVVSKLLARNDLAVADVDHFELNEAFAAQMVYVADELDIPEEKHNPLGGAVALGHPIGASGGILTTTMLYAMEREDHHRGIVGMSVGGGGAIAMSIVR